jgi:hypothetical protein
MEVKTILSKRCLKSKEEKGVNGSKINKLAFFSLLNSANDVLGPKWV